MSLSPPAWPHPNPDPHPFDSIRLKHIFFSFPLKWVLGPLHREYTPKPKNGEHIMKKTVLSTISAALIATAASNAQAGVFSDTYETCKNGVCAVVAAPGKIQNDITSTYGAHGIGRGAYNTTTSLADGYHGLRFIGRAAAATIQPLTWLDVPYYTAKGVWNLVKAPVKLALGIAELAVSVPTFAVHQAYKHPVLAASAAATVAVGIYNPAIPAAVCGFAGRTALSAAGAALDLSITGLAYGLKYSATGASYALQTAGSLASQIPSVAAPMLSSGAGFMARVFGTFSQTISLVF